MLPLSKPSMQGMQGHLQSVEEHHRGLVALFSLL